MKHHKLVKNPLFKIAGIALILYFALFSNKHDNRSLGRRYSSENIKESIGEAARKKKEIDEKINAARKLKMDLNVKNLRDNQITDKNEKK